MNWWEETEARAHRARTPASMAQTLTRRLTDAGIGPEFAAGPAYDLGLLYQLCADWIKLVEGLLLQRDGDLSAIRRQALALARWADYAQFWSRSSAPAFNQLIDSLELRPEALADREVALQAEEGPAPAEQAKLDGRYHYWHLLYDRLDLKLASVDLPQEQHRPLARTIARIYEQAVVTLRTLWLIERDQQPRPGTLARVLLEINTTWHFDLGPHHLGPGELRARPTAPGLQTLLLLAFGRNAGPESKLS